jgi:hypothetical protein
MRIKGRAALIRMASGLVVSTALSGLLSAQSAENSSTADTANSTASQLKRLSDGQPDIEGVWTTIFYGMGCLTNPTNGDVNCVPPPGPRPAAGTANAGGPPPADKKDVTLGQRGHGNPPDTGNQGAGGGVRQAGSSIRRTTTSLTRPPRSNISGISFCTTTHPNAMATSIRSKDAGRLVLCGSSPGTMRKSNSFLDTS